VSGVPGEQGAVPQAGGMGVLSYGFPVDALSSAAMRRLRARYSGMRVLHSGQRSSLARRSSQAKESPTARTRPATTSNKSPAMAVFCRNTTRELLNSGTLKRYIADLFPFLVFAFFIFLRQSKIAFQLRYVLSALVVVSVVINSLSTVAWLVDYLIRTGNRPAEAPAPNDCVSGSVDMRALRDPQRRDAGVFSSLLCVGALLAITMAIRKGLTRTARKG